MPFTAKHLHLGLLLIARVDLLVNVLMKSATMGEVASDAI